MDKPDNIIDSHRNMLMFSKNLSEFQINNLKGWPSVFFDGLEEAKVWWNFIKDDEFYEGEINYDIKLKERDKESDVGCNYLIASTKLMFWSDTKVNIYINGELWKIKSQKNKTTSQKKKKETSKNMSKKAVQV